MSLSSFRGNLSRVCEPVWEHSTLLQTHTVFSWGRWSAFSRILQLHAKGYRRRCVCGWFELCLGSGLRPHLREFYVSAKLTTPQGVAHFLVTVAHDYAHTQQWSQRCVAHSHSIGHDHAQMQQRYWELVWVVTTGITSPPWSETHYFKPISNN